MSYIYATAAPDHSGSRIESSQRLRSGVPDLDFDTNLVKWGWIGLTRFESSLVLGAVWVGKLDSFRVKPCSAECNSTEQGLTRFELSPIRSDQARRSTSVGLTQFDAPGHKCRTSQRGEHSIRFASPMPLSANTTAEPPQVEARKSSS